jgi:hypothetical protein
MPGEDLTLSEVVRRLDLNKATAQGILAVLADCGAAECARAHSITGLLVTRCIRSCRIRFAWLWRGWRLTRPGRATEGMKRVIRRCG